MILVIGDAMVDRYWFGTVTRVSPEAPVPVLAHGRAEDREGGAANVVANCRAMGAQCEGVYSKSYGTNPVVKLRLNARTQQIARVDFDTPQEEVSPEVLTTWLKKKPSVVIISDYAKGSVPDARWIIDACDAREIPVLVDPKGSDPGRYRGAHVIKPNHFEMQKLAGEWVDEEDLAARAEFLRMYYNIGAVLMTRGERGMTLFCEDGTFNLPGRHLELCDVSGAGDTAIAALAVGIDRGMTLLEAARLANKAAGVAVEKFGTSVVNWAEVAS